MIPSTLHQLHHRRVLPSGVGEVEDVETGRQTLEFVERLGTGNVVGSDGNTAES